MWYQKWIIKFYFSKRFKTDRLFVLQHVELCNYTCSDCPICSIYFAASSVYNCNWSCKRYTFLLQNDWYFSSSSFSSCMSLVRLLQLASTIFPLRLLFVPLKVILQIARLFQVKVISNFRKYAYQIQNGGWLCLRCPKFSAGN